jgi:hypothetical protein
MVAADLDDLISQLDGVEVTMLGGAVVTLNTQEVTIQRVEMSWMEDFLYAISDPNIAYLLLSYMDGMQSGPKEQSEKAFLPPSRRRWNLTSLIWLLPTLILSSLSLMVWR